MQGLLSEFTLAQLLQFFGLAERTGVITIHARDRETRIFVEGDKVIGWGLDSYDVQEAFLACESLPHNVIEAIRSVTPQREMPGLSFVVRNLAEPVRWELFSRRLLEQEVYPLLSLDSGEFDVFVGRCPPAPMRLSISVNSIILEGSRWESEMEAARLGGYSRESVWQRSATTPARDDLTLSRAEWLVWAKLEERQSLALLAAGLCLPDLDTLGAIRRLKALSLVERID